MRGCEARMGKLFSYVDLEARVPGEHPLRVMRGLVEEVLAGMSSEFEAMYASPGRLSILPERLLRALLLQAFYSIRSERQLMEQLNFTLLFRWFVGLGLDDPVWDASTFSHNRERFLAAEIAHRLLAGIATHRRVRRLLSRDHFSVDGTQIQAWASVKLFRPRGEGEAGGDGGGAGRGLGHGGPAAGTTAAHHLGRGQGLRHPRLRRRRRGDRGYCARCAEHQGAPLGRPDEVAASEGYALSLVARKRIEEIFGWTKSSAGKTRTLFRDLERVDMSFTFHLSAYNQIRLPKLLAAQPP